MTGVFLDGPFVSVSSRQDITWQRAEAVRKSCWCTADSFRQLRIQIDRKAEVETSVSPPYSGTHLTSQSHLEFRVVFIEMIWHYTARLVIESSLRFNLDSAQSKRIVMPEFPIPTVGTLIFFEDTEGNVVGAMQYEEEV
jgi:hypothetical protein